MYVHFKYICATRWVHIRSYMSLRISLSSIMDFFLHEYTRLL